MSVFTTILNTVNVRGMYPMNWDRSGLCCHTHFVR